MAAGENENTAPSQRRALDPRVEAWLRQIEQQDVPSLETLTPMQVREAADAAARELCGTPEAIANIENLTIPSPAGQIPVRIYMPQGNGPFPILAYFHGGGWVFCNLDTHDNVCRSLANGAGCVVVSVDYRLAPEHRFPAAMEDAYAATQWGADNAVRINGDPARIAVGGDSSGGNLAAGVSLMAKDQKRPSLMYQLLVNPATNLASLGTDSYCEFAEGYGLRKAEIEWYRDHYLESEEDWRHPYASPLLADDLNGLPPAFVITSEFDVLRDEGEAYAHRLKQARVPVTCIRCRGMIHFGFHWAVATDIARDAIDKAAAALRSAFSQCEAPAVVS
jgi:acetyl esterase